MSRVTTYFTQLTGNILIKINGDFMTREEYIEKLFSIYDLVSVLSRKNDGCVLRLRNRTLGRDLVLRSYPNSVAAYEGLLDVQCSNIPIIYDCISLSDGQIILEEYIDGVTVAEILESGCYNYLGAKKVIRSICAALEILHERGFVHRDVKPENIIVDTSGRIVLIDFNVSRHVSSASRDTVIMGTVGYASPEQLGISQSDARTDIYALGVLLNVMLTGKHPSEALARGRAGNIVRKCTSVNPDDRYRSVTKLSEIL